MASRKNVFSSIVKDITNLTNKSENFLRYLFNQDIIFRSIFCLKKIVRSHIHLYLLFLVCRPEHSVAKSFLKNTKTLYDWNYKVAKPNGQCVDELFINNFTEEQIWQQIELYNGLYLNKSDKATSNTIDEEGEVTGEDEEQDEDEVNGDIKVSDSEEDENMDIEAVNIENGKIQ